MTRKILAFLIGMFTFVVLVMAMQFVNGLLFGSPSAETMKDPAAMKEFVSKLPVGAFVLLLLGYIIGSIGSAFVMRIVSQWNSMSLPAIVGVLGTAGWAATISGIPHPMWVSLLGFVCFLPFTFLGHRLAANRSHAAARK